MRKDLPVNKILEEYQSGQSLHGLAQSYDTAPITISRIIKCAGGTLRHDVRKKDTVHVKGGDELIAWAKAQHRPVSKAELARQIGRKRLSPSYFIKYPELGEYVITRGYSELKDLHQQLYAWLKENNIPYKPDDRTKLGVSVSALLLGDYSNIALQIAEKPKCVSNEGHNKKLRLKHDRAMAIGINLVDLYKEHFDTDLQYAKATIGHLKSRK